MENKFLILIGRTFIATFILVNFFNLIPTNFGLNSWYVAVTMLLVDTASLMLLGLASLKIASFLSINGLPFVNSDKNSLSDELNLDVQQKQKFKKNLFVINKFSNYLTCFFISIAFLQTFVVVNGLSTLDIVYSEKVIEYERSFEIAKNKTVSQSKLDSINNDIENDFKLILEQQLKQKSKALDGLEKNVNNAKFMLFKNAMKVFLMSIVWAYGFFKLANF